MENNKHKIFFWLSAANIFVFCVLVFFVVNGPLKRFEPDLSEADKYMAKIRNLVMLIGFFSVVQSYLKIKLQTEKIGFKMWGKNILILTLVGALVFSVFEFIV